MGASASAQDTTYATGVQVEVEKISKLEVHKMPRASASMFADLGVKASKRKFNDRWQYFAFPIKVSGKAKGGKVPAFVPELTVTLHVLFKKQSNDGAQVKLTKKIKYVDIPLDPKPNMGEAKEVYVGAFISPADAFKITGDKKSDKGDLKGQIEAVAFEIEFEGDNCLKPGSERSYAFAGSRVDGKWWANPRLKSNEAELSVISETPYAMDYAGVFPATDPIVGAPAASDDTKAPAADDAE